MDNDNPVMRMIYVSMAAVAGAITALSISEWQKMKPGEIALTVFVGASFAIFAVPYLTVDLLGWSNETLTAACGLTYLGGTFANAIIPKLLRRLTHKLGLDEDKQDA